MRIAQANHIEKLMRMATPFWRKRWAKIGWQIAMYLSMLMATSKKLEAN